MSKRKNLSLSLLLGYGVCRIWGQASTLLPLIDLCLLAASVSDLIRINLDQVQGCISTSSSCLFVFFF